ncbi:MAG: hypothetical protein JRM86_00865 [Nitrososphaerota archaeon]|nr:hypothetical protein [Nitrososphaerota archaeon]
MRMRAYLRTNWGSPFVVGFMALLIGSAAELSAGASSISNEITIYAFYSLVLGVVLQIASYVKYGEGGANLKPAPEKKAAQKARVRPTRRILTAILVVALLVAASILAASGLIFPSTAPSGCRGARNSGTLFISSTQTVTIEVCGQSYVVKAGTGGGMTYAYHSGVVSLSAPTSANGTQFKAWYAVLNGNPQAPIGNRTTDLSLPSGLSAQSSSLEVFYAGQDPSAPSPAGTSSASSALANSSVVVSSTSASSSASSSGSTSTTSSAASSSSSSTTTSSSSSTSTALGGCQGGDGQVFLSTNLDGLVQVAVCGQQVELQGGAGGGIDYAYHAGPFALQAPQTVGGATFEYWYIAFPGFNEQVRNSSVVVQVPTGLAPGSAIIIAFYG